jgi:ribosomal-protein-alanine N-acetyltransferase
MMREMQTARLTIREFEWADSSDLFDLYHLPETSEFESWEPFQTELETRDLLKDWIQYQTRRPRREMTLAIALSKTGEMIGLCGIDLGVGTETDSNRVASLSYRLFPRFWGQGFATETLQCLIGYCFEALDLHRVFAGCAAGNHASSRVMEKAAMRFEAKTLKSFPIGNGWSDYLIYGLLQEEYVVPGY